MSSLDLHLVMQISKSNELYDAIIYVQNRAFCDYISPIRELLPVLQKALTSGRQSLNNLGLFFNLQLENGVYM